MSETQTWAEELPDDIRNHESIQKIGDLESAAKVVIDLTESQADLRGRLSASMTVPKADAPKEEWDAFESKLEKSGYDKADAAPDAPDGYELNGELDGLPMTDDQSKELQASLRKQFHAAGLGKRAAAKLAKVRVGEIKEAASGNSAVEAASTKALKEKFGDNFQKNMDVAADVAKRLGIGGLLTDPLFTMDGKPVVLGNNQELIMALIKMQDGVGEEGEAGGGSGEPVDSGPSLEDLQDERIKVDVKYGKMMRDDPGSAELRVLRRQRFMLSGKIAAKKHGQPFVSASPQDIANAIIPSDR